MREHSTSNKKRPNSSVNNNVIQYKSLNYTLQILPILSFICVIGEVKQPIIVAKI